MPSEKNTWEVFKQNFPGLAERIDARGLKGLPDVCWTCSGITGWVELKYKNLSHLRPEQCVWLDKWVAAGGIGSLVLQVDRDIWLLFRKRNTFRRLLRSWTFEDADVVGSVMDVILSIVEEGNGNHG